MKKIDKKILIGITLVLVSLLSLAISVGFNDISEDLDGVIKKTYLGKDYYIITDDYDEEYDLQYRSLSEYFNTDIDISNLYEKQEVMNYQEYSRFCREWDFEQKYNDEDKDYIVFSYLAYGQPNIVARLATVTYDEDATLYIWDDASGVTGDISAYVIVVPTSKDVSNVHIIPLYTEEEFKNIKKYNSPYDPHEITVDKPIIYLYPEVETDISIELSYPDKLISSYPLYHGRGWKVRALPNGNLIDLETGRELYALYYESEDVVNYKVENEGFVVEKENIITFLEEKLAILGLNQKEAEEFIIYWLPRLQENNYNYIRFASMDEINKNMELKIEPVPDTMIRVIMVYKGLDEKIDVIPQKLKLQERNGYAVVEWGGVEIK